MDKCQFGLVGLAVMGRNLVMNAVSRGFRVCVYNRTHSVTEEFLAENGDCSLIEGVDSLSRMVASLERPRKIFLMVKAGAPVDRVLEELAPLLEAGDIIADGGNSLFLDTERRVKEMAARGILYMGCGVSGGEEGALKGPSIMPGGSPEAWEAWKDILTRMAAVAEGDPCCRYMGDGGAGHFVKMVHNGIEYGDMQLICEAYDILHRLGGMNASQLEEVFKSWNRGDLESYLIQITGNIFGERDERTGDPLVERILDTAGQKGTGRWTVIQAAERGGVVSTINAAVEARVVSSRRDERLNAASLLAGPAPAKLSEEETKNLVRDVELALFASKIVSYAQGMDLLRLGSEHYGWNLRMGNIAAVWRGGCIIRARFLNHITDAYETDPGLRNLMLAPYFREKLACCQEGWRRVVGLAQKHGLPVPAFGASLGYYDSYRSPRLSANLLQAQRDYFGAHTFERVDIPGVFHHIWPEVDA